MISDIKINVRPAVAGYSAGMRLGPRRLHDFEFVWMLAGHARWRRHDTPAEHILEPGLLLLARPGMRDELAWDRRRSSRHGFVHFSLSPEPTADDWPLIRAIAPPAPIGALLDYLLWLAQEPDRTWQRAAEETISTILRIFVNGPLPDPSSFQPVEPAPLAAALDHVRREWNQRGIRPMPMAELATAAAVTREHLGRLFASHYGLGIITALERVRLARAAGLLVRTNLSITDIAHDCGFPDPLHFSRRFRAGYGSSPRTYRKTNIEAGTLTTPGLVRLTHRLSREPPGPQPALSDASP